MGVVPRDRTRNASLTATTNIKRANMSDSEDYGKGGSSDSEAFKPKAKKVGVDLCFCMKFLTIVSGSRQGEGFLNFKSSAQGKGSHSTQEEDCRERGEGN